MTDAMQAALEAAARAIENGSAEDWEALPLIHKQVFRSQAKAALTAALSSLEKTGFVLVPVELLERCRDREYNPFEPDNQTKLHDDLAALLAARPKIEG